VAQSETERNLIAIGRLKELKFDHVPPVAEDVVRVLVTQRALLEIGHNAEFELRIRDDLTQVGLPAAKPQ
jgi:hypothetical protein